MSEWQHLLVEDIASPCKYAMSTGPFGSAISSKFFREEGVPVIRGGNLSSNVGVPLDDTGLVFISNDKAKEFERSIVRSGDIIFTCWGTINQIGLIDERARYSEYVISNKQMKLTVDPTRCNYRFIYYLFSSPDKQQEILNNGIGAAVPGFNLGQLKRMPITLPPLFEQNAIANVLSSLDDKIDLLLRQNKTLEAMAETLFRQWFVEEAKEDWKEGTLADLIELHYGKGLKETERDGTGFPVVGSSGVVGYHSKKLVNGPGIVIGRKGTIGKVIYLFEDFFPIDTTYYIRSRTFPHGPMHFEYFLLMTVEFESSDSAVPGLNREIALATEIKVPPVCLIEKFNEWFEPCSNKLCQNLMQIRTLEKLRDTLLPKLMSGEVRVNYE